MGLGLNRPKLVDVLAPDDLRSPFADRAATFVTAILLRSAGLTAFGAVPVPSRISRKSDAPNLL
jgi:hypothetical protein